MCSYFFIGWLVAVGCANRKSHQHKYFIWKFRIRYQRRQTKARLLCVSHVANANCKQIYPHLKLSALSLLIRLSRSHSLNNLASKRKARILYFYWWFAKFCAKRLFDRSHTRKYCVLCVTLLQLMGHFTFHSPIFLFIVELSLAHAHRLQKPRTTSPK